MRYKYRRDNDECGREYSVSVSICIQDRALCIAGINFLDSDVVDGDRSHFQRVVAIGGDSKYINSVRRFGKCIRIYVYMDGR